MNKPFTTEPKTRRHVHFISGDRCRVFMQHLWDKGLRKKASPETLKFEFVQCFETNDRRTIVKYIGCPQKVLRYSASNMVRVNKTAGTVAQFNYQTTRRISRRRGLLEMLGLVTYSKNDGYYRLNHELMPYHTVQTSIQLPPQPPSRSNDEGLQVSKDNLRVCSVEMGESEKQLETTDAEVSFREVGEKKEEEVIDYTHTNPYLDTNMNRKVHDNCDESIVVRGSVSMRPIEKGVFEH